MSEASINQVFKRIGYAGRVTGHGFRHTMSTILHEKASIVHGLKPSLHIWIKMLFGGYTIMLSILRGVGK